jgi:hypothetical protein
VDLDAGDRGKDVGFIVGRHEQVQAVVESPGDLGDLEPMAHQMGLYRQQPEGLGLLGRGVAEKVLLSAHSPHGAWCCFGMHARPQGMPLPIPLNRPGAQ